MEENEEIKQFFNSKSILITGACGTIGRNLAKKLLKFKPKTLRLLDTDDSRLTELSDELRDQNDDKFLRFLIGDIRDKNRLCRACSGIDYIFHCAALKHVEIGEYNPREVIMTNIIGTANVIEAALQNDVKKTIFTSSDKAVNPANTMGASKLLGEKLIVAANYVRGPRFSIFASVRFGNVLGSRGSIIHRFQKRIEKGLTLIVTDPNVTRFMMPIQDAVNLTIKAMTISNGGEIFVLKMPSLQLKDLVDLFSENAWMNYGINPKIDTVDLFPGEKPYEELMTEEEICRSIELDEMYMILPHIKELRERFSNDILNQMGKVKTKAFSSRFITPLQKKELQYLIKKYKVFS